MTRNSPAHGQKPGFFPHPPQSGLSVQGPRWLGSSSVFSVKKISLFILSLGVTPSLSEGAPELTRFEQAPSNEAEINRTLVNDLIGLVESNTARGKYRAFRDAHPRGIGCVEARFVVDPRLEKRFQTGVFSSPGQSYGAIIRFSSSLGPAGDNVADARGMAIKLLGVTGPKLLESQKNALTHDFLQIDAPIFPTVDAEDFAGLVKIRLNPASSVGFLSKRTFQRIKALKAVLDLSTGNPNRGRSLADRTYFSQVPYLLNGPLIDTPIKFSSRPCGGDDLTSKANLDGTSAELRHELQGRLNQSDLCFDFGIQLYKENAGFKVEDGTNLWSENVSPFIKVATITIPKQKFMTDQKLAYCDALSFQPWHALEQHRPLGGINRTRKVVYEAISASRHRTNREEHLMGEPKDLSAWKRLNDPTYGTWKDVNVPAASPTETQGL